jgi:hypothetical protein
MAHRLLSTAPTKPSVTEEQYRRSIRFVSDAGSHANGVYVEPEIVLTNGHVCDHKYALKAKTWDGKLYPLLYSGELRAERQGGGTPGEFLPGLCLLRVPGLVVEGVGEDRVAVADSVPEIEHLPLVKVGYSFSFFPALYPGAPQPPFVFTRDPGEVTRTGRFFLENELERRFFDMGFSLMILTNRIVQPGDSGSAVYLDRGGSSRAELVGVIFGLRTDTGESIIVGIDDLRALFKYAEYAGFLAP